MSLDDDTVIAFLAFLALASGVLLIFLGRQSGDIATAAFWGLANVLIAVGSILLLQEVAVDFGFLAVMASTAMMWAALAHYGGRRIPPIWLVGGILVWAFVAFAPVADWRFGTRAVVFFLPSIAYLGGAMWELWRRRSDQSPARLPFMALLGVAIVGVAMIAIGLSPLARIEDDSTLGPLWPAVLVVTVFVAGSSALVVALIKERTADTHRIASETDGLTGIRNRSAAIAAGSAIMAEALADERDVAVVIFDLDHFKSVNDTYGHQTGDVVLIRFAEALQVGVRPGDVCGRIGGEEFIAVIPGSGEDAAVAIADRVRRSFAAAAEWVDGKPVRATVSAGIAIAHPKPEPTSLNALLSRADQSLYVAKRAGRNRVSIDGSPHNNPPDNLIHIA